MKGMMIFFIISILFLENFLLNYLNNEYDWYPNMKHYLTKSKKSADRDDSDTIEIETFHAFLFGIDIFQIITFVFGNLKIKYADLCDKELLLPIISSIFGKKICSW